MSSCASSTNMYLPTSFASSLFNSFLENAITSSNISPVKMYIGSFISLSSSYTKPVLLDTHFGLTVILLLGSPRKYINPLLVSCTVAIPTFECFGTRVAVFKINMGSSVISISEALMVVPPYTSVAVSSSLKLPNTLFLSYTVMISSPTITFLPVSIFIFKPNRSFKTTVCKTFSGLLCIVCKDNTAVYLPCVATTIPS